MLIFLTFNLSFDADILLFFAWALFWLVLPKIWQIFKSSGHPVTHQFPPLSRIEIQRTCDQKQKTYE
jgi:hypothetical protein